MCGIPLFYVATLKQILYSNIPLLVQRCSNKREFYSATLVVSFRFELNFLVFFLNVDKDKNGLLS